MKESTRVLRLVARRARQRPGVTRMRSWRRWRGAGAPARVRIVRLLLAQGDGTCMCGDICAHIPLAQSTYPST